MKVVALIMAFTGEHAFDECWNYVHDNDLDAICVVSEPEEEE